MKAAPGATPLHHPLSAYRGPARVSGAIRAGTVEKP
jgi:hypothetical protein